ncbi:MarR family transcriptional regulator [Virgibacillus sp. AGTR]|uniref:MarR family transcriptional regulator n=1 Tax=Virgibacillus salarius TaxID=447199 RepID=A0A941DYS7_9BACI|nr:MULTISPECIES: MarR family transcriptional regulator [Bacillaceae]MBR7797817.1 MarR family transcriptional regulator [Virgibacillus salarius]MCC2250359.1 MarR family transcriptional regulator [Virgibacillus sp. AGTR]MDY7044080.1 MarR family transcriptional regulator [Virgibacillus sp. M23]QRZ17625.1 MarR family transcriptional regulator [Virgibacillus sp. AGTR]WBX78979.1 MarR family transcriptional regulator [Virgibacillus salarius]
MLKSNATTDTINKIEKRMRYISGIIKQKGRQILNNYPITSPQFIALQWLLEEGDLTIGELSNRISLAFSTTTDLVDRMENNNLVERVRDAKDRRVVRIHVLEKGKTIIHEVIEKRQQYLGNVLENFSEEQVEDLHELLSYLHEQMISIDDK